MPIVARVKGSRIVYETTAWPAECSLSAMPKTSTMSAAEYAAEVAEFKAKGEERYEVSLHRRYCSSPTCPAPWAKT